jgi:uncharacterized protein YxjI
LAIAVTCACGASFRLKDEYAGKRLKCPKCAAAIQAPQLDAPPAADAGLVSLGYQAPAIGDGVFDRDKFLLRQKVMSLSQKYTVSDENERPIAYVVRPSHILRTLLAAVAAIAALAVIAVPLGIGFYMLNESLQLTGDTKEIYFIVTTIVVMVIAIAACILVAVLVSPKRHITFYRNEAKTDKLIDVLQDSKWQIIIATFTLRDAAGEAIAIFRKNYLSNFIRRQWRILTPDGSLICRAMEDSIILSLLRRFLGPMMGLLRTNFIICAGEGTDVIGEFNRKFTIVDRYVLDMTSDPERTLDRRIALALGVMLDTGERR